MASLCLAFPWDGERVLVRANERGDRGLHCRAMARLRRGGFGENVVQEKEKGVTCRHSHRKLQTELATRIASLCRTARRKRYSKEGSQRVCNIQLILWLRDLGPYRRLPILLKVDLCSRCR